MTTLRADTSPQRGDETLAGYMRRHAFTYAVTVALVAHDDIAAWYAAYCGVTVARYPTLFDYWNHAVEFPAWLEETADDGPQARFECKRCGGESPPGIGYVVHGAGPLPEPARDCPSPHQ